MEFTATEFEVFSALFTSQPESQEQAPIDNSFVELAELFVGLEVLPDTEDEDIDDLGLDDDFEEIEPFQEEEGDDFPDSWYDEHPVDFLDTETPDIELDLSGCWSDEGDFDPDL